MALRKQTARRHQGNSRAMGLTEKQLAQMERTCAHWRGKTLLRNPRLRMNHRQKEQTQH